MNSTVTELEPPIRPKPGEYSGDGDIVWNQKLPSKAKLLKK